MKKFVLLALLALSPIGLKAHFLSNCDIHPYIGISGGISPTVGQYSRWVTTELGTVDLGVQETNIGRTSGLFGGVAGLQTCFCNWLFAAVQFNGYYNTSSFPVYYFTHGTGSSAGILDTTLEVRNSFQWGFDGRLGFCFCGDISPYVLGGFEAGRWMLTLGNGNDRSSLGIPQRSFPSLMRTLYGPKVGAGVTFPLACHLAANLEYAYTWFGNVQADLLNTTSTSKKLYHHKINIRQNSFVLGVNYLF
jgi:opacity protein-like surface antigen